MEHAIGIDLGGSSVKGVAVTAAGEILRQENVSFTDDGTMNWAEAIRSLVRRLQPAGNDSREAVVRVGLSAPGLAAADGRSIAYMPGRLQGLAGLDWTKFLDVARPVPVLNDAHAALLGEAWVGAARGFRNVIMLTLGTGVGGAAMVDGRLLRGHIGRAGHLGHICLDPHGALDVTNTPGSLELAIGNCTIAQRSEGRFQTTHELVDAHLAGDAAATAVWLESVRALAGAVASFINILDPEAVLIGGGIARSGQALFQPLAEFLQKFEWRPGGHAAKILPAQLGEMAGAFGAARGALDQPPAAG